MDTILIFERQLLSGCNYSIAEQLQYALRKLQSHFATHDNFLDTHKQHKNSNFRKYISYRCKKPENCLLFVHVIAMCGKVVWQILYITLMLVFYCLTTSTYFEAAAFSS